MKKIIALSLFLAVSGSVFAQNADRMSNSNTQTQQSAHQSNNEHDQFTHMEHQG